MNRSVRIRMKNRCAAERKLFRIDKDSAEY